MAQQKPEENTTLDQVFKLVDKLTEEEREKLMYQLKLEELRRDIQVGIDQADRGELVSEEEVLEHLDACHEKLINRQK